MSDNTLIPTPGPDPKPLELVAPALPDVVTDSEADEAANELGLTFFKADKCRKLKKIGLFHTQQGVIHLGVGRLAAADEAIQKLLQTAVSIAENEKQDTKDRVGALVAANALISSLQKSISLMAEFQADRLIAGPASTKRRAFVDDSPVVPIQAQSGSTVNVNLVDAEKKD